MSQDGLNSNRKGSINLINKVRLTFQVHINKIYLYIDTIYVMNFIPNLQKNHSFKVTINIKFCFVKKYSFNVWFKVVSIGIYEGRKKQS